MILESHRYLLTGRACGVLTTLMRDGAALERWSRAGGPLPSAYLSLSRARGRTRDRVAGYPHPSRVIIVVGLCTGLRSRGELPLGRI
jgi:hypothetical protein